MGISDSKLKGPKNPQVGQVIKGRFTDYTVTEKLARLFAENPNFPPLNWFDDPELSWPEKHAIVEYYDLFWNNPRILPPELPEARAPQLA